MQTRAHFEEKKSASSMEATTLAFSKEATTLTSSMGGGEKKTTGKSEPKATLDTRDILEVLNFLPSMKPETHEKFFELLFVVFEKFYKYIIRLESIERLNTQAEKIKIRPDTSENVDNAIFIESLKSLYTELKRKKIEKQLWDQLIGLTIKNFAPRYVESIKPPQEIAEQMIACLPEEKSDGGGGKESSVTSYDPLNKENHMMVVCCIGKVMPTVDGSIVDNKKVYHITFAYNPEEFKTVIVLVTFLRYCSVDVPEGHFEWYEVAINNKKFRKDGIPYHFTIKCPDRKASRTGQLGKVKPEDTIVVEFEDPQTIPLLLVPVCKKRMGDGITSKHIRPFFDMDRTLIHTDFPQLSREQKTNYAWLRDVDVLRNNSFLTPLGIAAANSFGIIKVITSRRLGDSHEGMLAALREKFPNNIVTLEFQKKQVYDKIEQGRIKADTAMKHGGEGLPIFFEDHPETVRGLLQSGIVTVHVNEDSLELISTLPATAATGRPPIKKICLMAPIAGGKSTVLQLVSQSLGFDILSTDEMNRIGQGWKAYKMFTNSMDSAILDSGMTGGKVPKGTTHFFYLLPSDLASFWALTLVRAIIRRGAFLELPVVPELSHLYPRDDTEFMDPDDLVNSLGTILELVKFFGKYNNFVKGHFPDGEKIPEDFSGEVPEGSYIVIGYPNPGAKVWNTKWGPQMRNRGYTWCDGRWVCHKVTFRNGPEVGPESEDNDKRGDFSPELLSIIRAIDNTENEEDIPGKAVLVSKVDGMCIYIVTLGGNLARLWRTNIENSTCEHAKLIYNLAGEDNCVLVCSNGTGFMLGEHMWNTFVAAVMYDLGLEPSEYPNSYEALTDVGTTWFTEKYIPFTVGLGEHERKSVFFEITTNNRSNPWDDKSDTELASRQSGGITALAFTIGNDIQPAFVEQPGFMESRIRVPAFAEVQSGMDIKRIQDLCRQVLNSPREERERRMKEWQETMQGEFCPEGFVLQVLIDGTWHYCKVKNPEFYAAHTDVINGFDTLIKMPEEAGDFFPAVLTARSLLTVCEEVLPILKSKLDGLIRDLIFNFVDEVRSFVGAKFTGKKPTEEFFNFLESAINPLFKMDPNAVRGCISVCEKEEKNGDDKVPKITKMIFNNRVLCPKTTIENKPADETEVDFTARVLGDFILPVYLLERLHENLPRRFLEIYRSPGNFSEKLTLFKLIGAISMNEAFRFEFILESHIKKASGKPTSRKEKSESEILELLLTLLQ